MPIERKLAAIMFTDIAGYTESMSKSESKSLDTLEKKRSILKPLLKEYKGTFVKEIGDGTLSYFESSVNAATCAVKLQETAYIDIQQKADNLKPNVASKFLSYPIPKTIVEEWEKVK